MTKKGLNAMEVLEAVEFYIESGDRFRIVDVYNELSIFDWWNDWLSQSQLKDMRKFLKEAIKLGFTGYVCFKVGAKYCANGMWAYKAESTTGYSPDGDRLYKSFAPDYNYWEILFEQGQHLSAMAGKEYHELKTIRDLERAIFETDCNH